MAGQRSREDLKAFLDWVGAKGLMPLATVHARKAAVNNILEILSEEEASDVTLINIDELMSRYSNLKGKNYTPDSLKTYQSRLSKALEDFEIYVENPMGFRPSGGKRKISTAGKESVKLEKNRPNVASPPIGVSAPSVPPPSANIIPIAIRQDLIIHVQGIPFDLTKAEAQRVANVILAMAMETS
jgi:hypothetical protein